MNSRLAMKLHQSDAQRVRCGNDLKKQRTPQQKETVFTMVISALLLMALFTTLAFLGGVQ